MKFYWKNFVYLQMVKNISLNNKNVSLIFDIKTPTNGALEVKSLTNIKVVVEDVITFLLSVDERYNSIDFDDIEILNSGIESKSSHYIYNNYVSYFIKKFKDLIGTDFRYKNGDGFQGSKTIYAIDFINYLTKCNRENNITKILND